MENLDITSEMYFTPGDIAKSWMKDIFIKLSHFQYWPCVVIWVTGKTHTDYAGIMSFIYSRREDKI